MANGYKRLTRKARHLIRGLRREKHATVQRTMAHELKREVTRTHGGHGKGGIVNHGAPGHYRRMSPKAQGILTRLSKAKVWAAQRQLVNELVHEMERMGRRAARARKAAARARQRTARAARATARAAKATGRGIAKADRATQSGVARSQPHVTRAAKGARTRIVQARARRHARRHPFGRPQRAPVTRTTPTIAQSRPLRTGQFALKRTPQTTRATRPRARA